MQFHKLLPELAHERGLLLDEDEPAVIDDADAIGHFLCFVDIVCRQDDRDAGIAQLAHDFPHTFAQLHIDARGRLV